MGIEEFTEMVCEKLEKELSMCKIQSEKVQKNNGKELMGIRITKKQSNISPTIYMENYFEEYKTDKDFSRILEDIINCYMYAEENRPIKIEQFSEFENVREQIVYKLINFEKNEKLLEDTPYIMFLDLAVVFYYICSTNLNSQASILIKDSHLQLWNKTKEDLFEFAATNTPRLLKVSLRGMESIVHEMMEEDGMDPLIYDENDVDEEVMYVLTNENGVYGAACLLYHQVLENFCEKIKSDFYILPSSIHEVILVPEKEEVKRKRLKRMVKEVNETEVLDEDILSYNVYFYSQKNHKFSIA